MIWWIGIIELWIREYTIGEDSEPPWGQTSIIRPSIPPGPGELSLFASSGSRSSACVIHSRYPLRSSSICCFSLSFWKSPLDFAFSLSFENSLEIEKHQTISNKGELNRNPPDQITGCEIPCELAQGTNSDIHWTNNCPSFGHNASLNWLRTHCLQWLSAPFNFRCLAII